MILFKDDDHDSFASTKISIAKEFVELKENLKTQKIGHDYV